jgi:hypothetical protein
MSRTPIEETLGDAENGAAMAAVLAAGIGAFAVGFVVILNEAGLFAAPAIYAPAGGVTGRTALATAIWLVAWFGLHVLWNDRAIESRSITVLAGVLIALGILFTLPPVWGLL